MIVSILWLDSFELAVCHRAIMGEVFGQKVAQSRPTKVFLSPPRAVCVFVETGNCNDTKKDQISSRPTLYS
jgi:hypothetical protein